MLILKPNVRHSTFALLMELVVLLNTASFVPMEPFSTRTTSSATGGLTLIVPQPRISTASMMRLLLKEMPLLEPLIKLSMVLHLSTEQPLLQLVTTLQLMLVLEDMRKPEEQPEGWMEIEGEVTEEEEEMEDGLVRGCYRV